MWREGGSCCFASQHLYRGAAPTLQTEQPETCRVLQQAAGTKAHIRGLRLTLQGSGLRPCLGKQSTGRGRLHSWQRVLLLQVIAFHIMAYSALHPTTDCNFNPKLLFIPLCLFTINGDWALWDS